VDPYGSLLFAAGLSLCVAGFHGGLLFGVRFLRRHELIDMRPPQFIHELLFGRLGTYYRLFYRAYGERHGRGRAKLLLAIHFAGGIGFVVFPFFAEGLGLL
jgi:hypothetical protein